MIFQICGLHREGGLGVDTSFELCRATSPLREIPGYTWHARRIRRFSHNRYSFMSIISARDRNPLRMYVSIRAGFRLVEHQPPSNDQTPSSLEYECLQ